MSNALFGHINKTRWAAVRMMFARQAADKESSKKTIAYASENDAPEEDRAFIASKFEKRRKRMDRVDNMTPDMRAVVHDYGLTVVDAFVQHGVTNPRIIRHLINTVFAGSVNGNTTAQIRIFEERRP